MRTSPRLDPVGRFRLPRRPVLVRTGIAAVLLLTAAGVLYSGDGDGDGRPDPAAPAAPAAPGAPPPPSPATPAGPGPESRLPVPDGMVGVPVPIGDPAGLTAVVPGDRVDLLGVPSSGSPVPLASAAAVLAVDPGAGSLLLALTPAQGREALSASAAAMPFAILVRPDAAPG